MPTHVTIYENGLIRAVQTDGKGWNRRVAEEVKVEAEWICPWGTSGELRHSHGIEQNRIHGAFGTGFNVYNDARHAIWVHEGTGIYGPRGTPIVPVNTPKKKYMHLPPGMGFFWSKTTKVHGGPKRKGVRRYYERIFDPSDPFGHAESVDGSRGRPWLLEAGENVTHRHG